MNTELSTRILGIVAMLGLLDGRFQVPQVIAFAKTEFGFQIPAEKPRTSLQYRQQTTPNQWEKNAFLTYLRPEPVRRAVQCKEDEGRPREANTTKNVIEKS